MIATVKSGNLQRWFEQLCRIRFDALKKTVTDSETQMKREVLPTCGGVYAFWWTGRTAELRRAVRDRKLILKGPGGRPVTLRLNDDWLALEAKLPIPLYVGKSAASIRKRVSQHLMLRKERILKLGQGAEKAEPPTTSCQLRAGIDHYFPNQKNTRDIVLHSIGISYVALDGAVDAANRFYLEDLAIGLMRPPLNVDVER